jgi:hypothetical protein
VAGSCDESSGSVKGGAFLDYLRDSQLHKEEASPWSWLIKYIKYLTFLSVGILLSKCCDCIAPFLYPFQNIFFLDRYV